MLMVGLEGVVKDCCTELFMAPSNQKTQQWITQKYEPIYDLLFMAAKIVYAVSLKCIYVADLVEAVKINT